MSYKIIVTGASSGIGRATVLEYLLQSGHEILALARRQSELENLQKKPRHFSMILSKLLKRIVKILAQAIENLFRFAFTRSISLPGHR